LLAVLAIHTPKAEEPARWRRCENSKLPLLVKMQGVERCEPPFSIVAGIATAFVVSAVIGLLIGGQLKVVGAAVKKMGD
jgi:hypothetical protein